MIRYRRIVAFMLFLSVPLLSQNPVSNNHRYNLEGLEFDAHMPGMAMEFNRWIDPADNSGLLNYFVHSGLWVGVKNGDEITVVSGDGNPVVSEFTEWKVIDSIHAVDNFQIPDHVVSVKAMSFDDLIPMPGHTPVGVTVKQRTFEMHTWPGLILEYTVTVDNDAEAVSVGFYADFDLPEPDHTKSAFNDQVRAFPNDRAVGMSNAGDWSNGFIPGMAVLSDGQFNYRVIGSLAEHLTDAEKWDILTQSDYQTEFTTPDDYRFVLSSDSRPLAAGDSIVFTVALVHTRQQAGFTGRVNSITNWYNAHNSMFKRSSPRRGILAQLPTELTLSPNYPNPFNPTTTFSIGLPEATAVTLAVYDLLGRQVQVLHKGQLEAGTYNFKWEGTNASGSSMGSGIYLLRLRAGAQTVTQKMILLH